MLSLKRYGWLCVLGGEVIYLICLAGGYLPFRTARATKIHHAFFETLPGFVRGSFVSIIIGTVYIFIFSWIFAAYMVAYMVWMHNSSLIKQDK